MSKFSNSIRKLYTVRSIEHPESYKKDIQNIVEEHLAQVGINEDGIPDAGMLDSGTSTSQSNRIGLVKQGLWEINDGDPVTKEELVEETGIDEIKVEETLGKLARSGDVLEPIQGEYRIF